MPNLNQPRLLNVALVLLCCTACDAFYDVPCPDGRINGSVFLLDKERITISFANDQWDFLPETLRECTSVSALTVGSRMHLDVVEQLEEIGALRISILDGESFNEFNRVTSIGSLTFGTSSLDVVTGFASLTQLNSLFMNSNNGISVLRGLDNITDLPGGFRNGGAIRTLEALGSLETAYAFQPRRVPFPQDFPMLRTVETDFSVSGSNLETIGFNALETVGRDFRVGGHNQLTTWGFESLHTIGGTAIMLDNDIIGGQVIADWLDGVDVGGGILNCDNGGEYENDCIL